MKENEAIKWIKSFKNVYRSIPKQTKEACETAIKALEEVQEYRKIGTVEELKAAQKYIELAKKHGTIGKVIDACAEYESIGTVEELKSLKENGAFSTEELITIRVQQMALEEYQKIGTVEECREAMEKNKPKKILHAGRHNRCSCPSCNMVLGWSYSEKNCKYCGQRLEEE